ncbi:Clr5 domain-containing protein [Fusarium sp. Ph1]|nr:Clr5 domain-containing protein [Fusarium sp. Ph1]
MPPAARISLPLWEREKEHIRALYLDQNKTLDELVKCMAEDHGFYATRAQYIRRLDSWKMRKYSTKEEWEYVDSLVRKRKLEGKESEIIMGGKPISVKKLKKELGRYGQPSSSEKSCSIPPNDALEGIVACTPPATVSVSFGIKLIRCTTVPWFLFHDSFIRKAISAFKHMTESDVRQSALAKKMSKLDFAVLKDGIGSSTVAEKLKKTIPQKPSADASALQVQFPAAQLFVQIICWAIYQISNNLLFDDPTDNFLQWIIDHGSMQFLRQLTHLNDPVTRVLKANLLLSAIRLYNRDTVQVLLENGANPNIINHISLETALQLAVKNKLNNAEIVRLLLEYGACPNTTYPGSVEARSPLCLALADLPQKRSIAKMLILAGADVNVSYSDPRYSWIDKRETPLRAAAAQGDAFLTSLLLEKGANPNVFYHGSSSALHTAVKNNHVGSIKALLEAGADANIPYGEGNQLDFDDDFDYDLDLFSQDSPYDALDSLLTPIDIAYKIGNGQVIDLLLQANAHVDGYLAFVANWDQHISYIVLRDAARRGERHLVETLLMAGVDVNTSLINYDGQTALQAAAESGNMDMVRLLLDRGAFVNAPPNMDGGLTALQAAVSSGNRDIIELLIRQGGEINAEPAMDRGQTCLTAAVSTGNIDLVDMLLSLGAGINPTRSGPDCFETSALAWSISKDDHQLFDLLMSKGAKPDLPQDWPTPLHAAIIVRSFDMAFRLIEAGADVNRPSWDGDPIIGSSSFQTPLEAAIVEGNNRLINLLIDCHADINYSPDGMRLGTALRTAILYQDREVVQLLLSHGADPGSAMSLASVISNTDSPVDLEIFRMLINHNAEINPQPEEMAGFEDPTAYMPHLTPLQAALSGGHKELASMLLEAGADCNAPAFGRWGTTALQAAAMKGSMSFVEHFVSQGANINAPPAREHGATALQFAAIQGHYNIVVFLLENGADVNAPGAVVGGRTALQGASGQGRLDIIHLLLENDQEEESLGQRCQEAAVFAEKNRHFVIAEILRGWKKPG